MNLLLSGGAGTVHVADGKDFSKANIDLMEKVHSKAHRLDQSVAGSMLTMFPLPA